jgi:hypothetical protein
MSLIRCICPWTNERLNNSAPQLPEKIIVEGSDEEDSPILKAERQRRREAIGQRYLRGHAPFIESAQLRGPFTRESGWKNPWKNIHKRIAKTIPQTSSTDEAGQHNHISKERLSSIRKRNQKLPGPLVLEEDAAKHASARRTVSGRDVLTEYHLPSIEPLPNEEATEYDDEKLPLIHQKRFEPGNVLSEDELLFHSQEPRGTKRTADSNWLKGAGLYKRSRGSMLDPPSPTPKIRLRPSLAEWMEKDALSQSNRPCGSPSHMSSLGSQKPLPPRDSISTTRPSLMPSFITKPGLKRTDIVEEKESKGRSEPGESRVTSRPTSCLSKAEKLDNTGNEHRKLSKLELAILAIKQSHATPPSKENSPAVTLSETTAHSVSKMLKSSEQSPDPIDHGLTDVASTETLNSEDAMGRSRSTARSGTGGPVTSSKKLATADPRQFAEIPTVEFDTPKLRTIHRSRAAALKDDSPMAPGSFQYKRAKRRRKDKKSEICEPAEIARVESTEDASKVVEPEPILRSSRRGRNSAVDVNVADHPEVPEHVEPSVMQDDMDVSMIIMSVQEEIADISMVEAPDIESNSTSAEAQISDDSRFADAETQNSNEDVTQHHTEHDPISTSSPSYKPVLDEPQNDAGDKEPISVSPKRNNIIFKQTSPAHYSRQTPAQTVDEGSDPGRNTPAQEPAENHQVSICVGKINDLLETVPGGQSRQPSPTQALDRDTTLDDVALSQDSEDNVRVILSPEREEIIPEETISTPQVPQHYAIPQEMDDKTTFGYITLSQDPQISTLQTLSNAMMNECIISLDLPVENNKNDAEVAGDWVVVNEVDDGNEHQVYEKEPKDDIEQKMLFSPKYVSTNLENTRDSEGIKEATPSEPPAPQSPWPNVSCDTRRIPTGESPWTKIPSDPPAILAEESAGSEGDVSDNVEDYTRDRQQDIVPKAGEFPLQLDDSYEEINRPSTPDMPNISLFSDLMTPSPITKSQPPKQDSRDFQNTQELVDVALTNPWTDTTTKSNSGKPQKRVSFGIPLDDSGNSPKESTRETRSMESPPPEIKNPSLLLKDDKFHSRLKGTRNLVLSLEDPIIRFLKPGRRSSLARLSSPDVSAMAEAFLAADRETSSREVSKEKDYEGNGRRKGITSTPAQQDEASGEGDSVHVRENHDDDDEKAWSPLRIPDELPLARVIIPTASQSLNPWESDNDDGAEDLPPSFSITPMGKIKTTARARSAFRTANAEGGDDLDAVLDDMGSFLEGWDVDEELRRVRQEPLADGMRRGSTARERLIVGRVLRY